LEPSETRSGKWLLPILGWLAFMLWLIPGGVWAAEFSAQVVSRLDGRETQGKVYVKDKNMRLEMGGSRSIITILRSDKGVFWSLMPERKMYLEMPLTQEMTRDLGQFAQDHAKMTSLGRETVGGYLCDKYETEFKTNGGSIKHYMWIAQKLGMSIKIVSLDNSFSREYRDIKEGAVPDAVFEVPPGFIKMNVP
jgi:hypothetical protein